MLIVHLFIKVIQRFCLCLFLLSMNYYQIHASLEEETTDWLDLALGAIVVEEDKAHQGDVWGILGKDGGYRVVANFPFKFTIDLGEVRDVQSFHMSGPQWELWAPDEFALDFMDENGHWHNLVYEDGWAENSKSAYIFTLPNPVRVRKIHFEVKKGGWNRQSTEQAQRRIRNAYGDRILISRFSLYPTTRVAELLEPAIALLGYAGRRIDFINSAHSFWLSDMASYKELEKTYQYYAERLISGEGIQVEDQDHISQLNEQLKVVERQVADSRNNRLATASGLGYLVGTLSPYERPMSDLYSGEVGNSLVTYSAGHEYEDFHLALVAQVQDLSNVRVEVSDLVLENGDTVISSEHVTLYRGVYINTGEPHYTVDHVGKWLDGLVPLRDQERIQVRKGKVQPVWGTIYTPAGQKPGLYRGTVTIYPENAPEFTLDIFHHVWDFSLPVEVSLKNVFSLSPQQWRQYYGKNWHDGGMANGFKEFAEFWLKRRLNPTSLYVNDRNYLEEPMPEYRYVDYFLAKGMNAFNLGRAHDGPERSSHQWFNQFLERVKLHDQEVRRRGSEDKAFIYLADEPFSQSFNEIIRRGREIKKVTNIPTYIAIHQSVQQYPDELKEVVDIWGPIFSTYERNREWFQERRQQGDQVWWYFVGWGINMDQSPLKARVFPWLTWNEGLEGVMQWCGNRYWHVGQTIEEWDGRSYQTHNGIGNYVYPGPDGEMYPSLRLEHMRDGMEDYEYLRLLERIVEIVSQQKKPDMTFLHDAKQALDLRGLITGITRFNDDYRLFEERRQWIGRLIHSKADLLR